MRKDRLVNTIKSLALIQSYEEYDSISIVLQKAIEEHFKTIKIARSNDRKLDRDAHVKFTGDIIPCLKVFIPNDCTMIFNNSVKFLSDFW
jgi:hypothetical protein